MKFLQKSTREMQRNFPRLPRNLKKLLMELPLMGISRRLPMTLHMKVHMIKKRT